MKQNLDLREYTFIFDIDGTLIDMRTIWEKTYRDLYQQEQNISLTEEELKSLFGPPELTGHSNILNGRNCYTPEKAQLLTDETETTMAELLKKTDLTPHHLPGVPDCLMELQRLEATLACATGNLEAIAHKILQQASLNEYFPVVACAQPTTKDRSEIIQQVLAGLQQQGHHCYLKKTYVIGDTPSDIRAAKKIGLHSIGVATGHYSQEELLKEQPNFVLPNLRGYNWFSSLPEKFI